MRTTRHLLWILSLWMLASCASWKPLRPAPEPPRIDCNERAPAEPLPRRPRLASLPEDPHPDAWWRDYVRRLTATLAAYEVRLMGWGTAEVLKRAEVADCLERERAAGRIR